MKMFTRKMYLIILDGYPVSYHTTFKMFVKSHGNELAFYTKTQVEDLKKLNSELVVYEVKDFNVVKVKE